MLDIYTKPTIVSIEFVVNSFSMKCEQLIGKTVLKTVMAQQLKVFMFAFALDSFLKG